MKSHNKTSPFKVKNSMAFNTSCFCCSVTNSCPVLRKSMDCSMPGSSVLHYRPVCSNSCPLSQWCHPTISFSVTLFSTCTQSFLAAISFPVSSFFTSGGQIIGGSASSSVLPMDIKSWFPLELTGYICWILMWIDSWMECKFRKILDWNGMLSFHMKLYSKRLKKSNELWVKVYLTGIFTIL